MLATSYKSTISHDWAYPVGAEIVSQALEGVPQFDCLKLSFYHGSNAKPPLQRREPYQVMKVAYRNLRPGLTAANLFIRQGFYEETLEIKVSAVPFEVRRAVKDALVSEGFAQIRSWLSAKRDPVWLYGIKSFTLKFDESKNQLTSQEAE